MHIFGLNSTQDKYDVHLHQQMLTTWSSKQKLQTQLHEHNVQGIMVRLMHKKYSQFLMMKHSVLLFINLALVVFFSFFYKNSIYTVYRAIHQLFVFSYKHFTSKKMVPLPYVKNQHRREEKIRKGSWC